MYIFTSTGTKYIENCNQCNEKLQNIWVQFGQKLAPFLLFSQLIALKMGLKQQNMVVLESTQLSLSISSKTLLKHGKMWL